MPRKLGRPKGGKGLGEDIKFDIRRDRLMNDMTLKEIAKKYDVAVSTVQKILSESRND